MSDEPQRPTSTDDRNAWGACWTAQGMPWRTEPEIDVERQRFLAERRATEPDMQMGIYPFKDLRLTRADVEWLLSTHESNGMRGPVDWSDPSQRRRDGPNLSAADLREANLNGLPLARAVLVIAQLQRATLESGQLQGASLQSALLYGANLTNAQVQEAVLDDADLQEALLKDAQLAGASLLNAHLQGAMFDNTDMQSAILTSSEAQRAFFLCAHLQDAQLSSAELEGASFLNAELQRARLDNAKLHGAFLDSAHLDGAFLCYAHLQGAFLNLAQLHGAQLTDADLQGTKLVGAGLQGAWLSGARMDGTTDLADVELDDETRLADVAWHDAPLMHIPWHQATRLGDESEARRHADADGAPKDRQTRLADYAVAVRAYRQLALALRGQGLHEDADRFAYRAQVCQRQVLWRQALLPQEGWRIGLSQRLRKLATYLGSGLLDLISGYGYRPLRSFITYALVVVGFAAVYFLLRDSVHPALSPLDSLIFSITSFHGRGFSPGEEHVGLSNPLTIFAAIEAIIGLLIEITFIATFTQRFFAR